MRCICGGSGLNLPPQRRRAALRAWVLPPPPRLRLNTQTGKLSLRAVHAFERELRRAGEFLQEALDQLAGCIEGSVRYKE